jgi:putative zinc finger/helix-turn-helix YgiT family protein
MSKISKCYECGSRDVRERVEPRPMPMCLGWSVLVEETIVTTCGACGEEALGYRKLGPMMRAIAAAVVRKPSRLAPDEIKFLRTHLGYEGKELARLLGVGASTVSRWENGHEPIGVVPDRLLRTLEVIREGVEFDVEVLGDITSDEGAPMDLRVRMRDGQWKVAA